MVLDGHIMVLDGHIMVFVIGFVDSCFIVIIVIIVIVEHFILCAELFQ